MSGELTRRGLLRASAAATVGLGSIGTASAGVPTHGGGRPDDLEAERIPALEFSDEQLQTEAVSGTPERATDIRPGSQMFISYPDGTTAGCTANFIWEQRGSGQLYIGAAGHCFLPSDRSASRRAATPEEKQNGEAYDVKQLEVSVCADCTFGGLTGLAVVGGETISLGDVAYARQVAPDSDGGSYEEVGHDFGLVEIPKDKEDVVDPSLPQFGGPTGVSDDAVPEGEPVNQYGAGVANGEVYPTMGSNGVSLGSQDPDGESWYAGIRASPGDSGSPLQSTAAGDGVEGEDAAGILTHLTTLGTAGTTMAQCRRMAERDVNLDVSTVLAE